MDISHDARPVSGSICIDGVRPGHDAIGRYGGWQVAAHSQRSGRPKTAVAIAGPDPWAVLDATYSWYWAVDAQYQAGAEVQLAHPLGVKMFTLRRVKNDMLDGRNLADLLRMEWLAESCIAPSAVGELQELVRHQHSLAELRAGLRCQVSAILTKQTN